MTGPEDTPTIANPVTPDFRLTPPQVITAVPAEAARGAVPLRPDAAAAADQEAQRLAEVLLTQAVHGALFKAAADRVGALGRDEAGAANALVHGGLQRPGFAAARETAACAALAQARSLLVGLDPGRRGDLLARGKVFGLLPTGDGLKAYFREFDAEAAKLQASLLQICTARGGLQQDMADLEAARSRLWEAMQRLAAVVHLATTLASALGQRLSAQAGSGLAVAPTQAQVIESEVLPVARERLDTVLAQQAACVNAYLALGVLKKAGREMMNGCSRVATSAMSVLALAQTVARATGHEMASVQQVLTANTALDRFIAEAGHRVDSQAGRAAQFAGTPRLGVQALQEAFALAFKAIDAMQALRAQVVAVAAQNDAVVAGQAAGPARRPLH